MQKYTMETSVGIFVLVCLLCVGYLTVQLGKVEVLGSNTYVLNARFTSVSGLKDGTAVEMAGVRIGTVASIRLDPEEKVALVKLKIDNNIKIADDAIASVKTSGLIGDKYIGISPGGSPITLEPGELIVDTESAVDLEELISKYVFGEV